MPHRLSTRSWGLARPPAMNAAALHTEKRWRWPVLIGLLCTIPAFYIELLEDLPTPLAVAIYLGAAGLIVLSLSLVASQLSHPRQYLRSNAMDLVLAVGLVAAALLPPSVHSQLALGLRLFVAMLTLVHMAWAIKFWVTRGGLGYLLALAMLVLFFCGVGFWALEPRVHSLGDGLWLAFTTAATVGYGDIVPTTPAAKIFSVFVVLLGYAVLSLVTAAIASFWVESSERRMEQDILRDMHAQLRSVHEELAALREEVQRGSSRNDS
ncbi:potassium channel family protein [Paucibacter sp. B2R-40]|uniref:potassium channel family protein n=1 Tax=Paucibacter sp. B2R-40 TaxID=2893554 RepID=UPI0021E4C9C3|nr:potassium channel family protein [Paucibacter sp. B2R-40]MCV2356885.1 potassium channel family protein [Paucibacter sp. B2R-40]